MAWARRPVRRRRFSNLLGRDTVAGERIIDVQNLDIADRGSDLDRLQSAHRRPVSVRGIAINELLKHPDAGPESRIARHL